MKKTIIPPDDYAFSRVPLNARKGLLTVSVIRIGASTSLLQFMLGATLGHSMTFGQAMLATLLGSLFLEFISLGLGIAGAREGLSATMLSRWCGFGRRGSALIGVIIAVCGIGWFGVQNAVVAKGVARALRVEESQYVFFVTALLSGSLITLLVAFGFRGLSWIAKAAVPFFFLVMAVIIYKLLKNNDFHYLLNMKPSGPELSVRDAATAAVGGHIVLSIISPDMSRFCKNTRHVFWLMTSSVFIGECVINSISVLVAHALNTADVVKIMTHSAGLLGLLSVLLSVIKINDINLYSATLGLSNFLAVTTGKQWRFVSMTLLLGAAGTLISMTGILEQFTRILRMLGVLFPPVAGIMLTDYYILRTHRELLDTTRKEWTLPLPEQSVATGNVAVVSWIAGSAAGFFIKWGIATLNSLLIAALVYWLVRTFSENNVAGS